MRIFYLKCSIFTNLILRHKRDPVIIFGSKKKAALAKVIRRPED